MNDQTANSVVAKMMQDDKFSQWLGIEILEIKEGYSKIKMTLREEMVNGFGVIHGGVTFSFADSALAFACNNRNNLSVALDVAISFTRATYPGDILVAEADEIHNGRSTGVYVITVTNQKGQKISIFKGTCFRTGKNLI